MRARLLVLLPLVALTTAAVAFGATMLSTGERAAGPRRSGVLTVKLGHLTVGQVTTRIEPVDALGATQWPILITAESKSTFLAFLGRSPRLGCRVNWIDDPHVAHFATSPQVAFEDPCGGAQFAVDGTCLGGPCNRGLDRFRIDVTDGTARIDLRTLIPGPPLNAAP